MLFRDAGHVDQLKRTSAVCLDLFSFSFPLTAFDYTLESPFSVHMIQMEPLHFLSFKDELAIQVWPVRFLLPLDHSISHVI